MRVLQFFFFNYKYMRWEELNDELCAVTVRITLKWQNTRGVCGMVGWRNTPNMYQNKWEGNAKGPERNGEGVPFIGGRHKWQTFLDNYSSLSKGKTTCRKMWKKPTINSKYRTRLRKKKTWVIGSMPWHSPPEPDSRNFIFLKKCKTSLPQQALNILWEKSLNFSVIAEFLKLPLITRLHKWGSRAVPKNFQHWHRI